MGRVEEASGDGQRNMRYVEMKFVGDGCEDEGEDEEIEGVECPAEKTGEQGVALIRARFGGSGAHANGGAGIAGAIWILCREDRRRSWRANRRAAD